MALIYFPAIDAQATRSSRLGVRLLIILLSSQVDSGCMQRLTILINENPMPDFQVQQPPNSICVIFGLCAVLRKERAKASGLEQASRETPRLE